MWTRLLGNSEAIDAVYAKAPSLLKARLHEVRLHHDGPRISLRLDLNEFPEQPPSKWIVCKFNRAQLTLVLIDVQRFQMQGWSANNLGDVEIDKCDDGVQLTFRGGSATLECRAGFVEVEKLSGYCDSELEA
jgi:hypothetical protein